ncbi:MAG: antitoxin family protein [Bryobacteraceae bacterium]
MTIRVEAIFENGVLRPVEPIPLYDRERVTVTLVPLDDSLDHEYLAQCQADRAKRGGAPRTIAEIQERWKDIPGSFADLIIQERGDH